jgi:hypothetical protein
VTDNTAATVCVLAFFLMVGTLSFQQCGFEHAERMAKIAKVRCLDER